MSVKNAHKGFPKEELLGYELEARGAQGVFLTKKIDGYKVIAAGYHRLSLPRITTAIPCFWLEQLGLPIQLQQYNVHALG